MYKWTVIFLLFLTVLPVNKYKAASPMIKSISTKMSLTLGGFRAATDAPSSRISTAVKHTLYGTVTAT